MNRDLFWLTDEQFRRIEPHLPTDTRGKARVDDRRVISGIVHVLKSGGRWIDAPAEYGVSIRRGPRLMRVRIRQPDVRSRRQGAASSTAATLAVWTVG